MDISVAQNHVDNSIVVQIRILAEEIARSNIAFDEFMVTTIGGDSLISNKLHLLEILAREIETSRFISGG